MSPGPLSTVIVFAVDVGRLAGFYRDVLGLEVAYPAGKGDLSGEHWVAFATGGCSLALHSGKEPGAPPSSTSVNFSVEDVDAARARLVGKGVEMEEVQRPFPGLAFCTGRDPEGNPFQVETRAGP